MIGFYVAMIFCNINLFAQKRIELSKEYYFEIDKPSMDRVSVKKLTYPKKHLSKNIEKVEKQDESTQMEYFENFWDHQDVVLEPGDYHCMSVTNQEFNFTINKNGYLDGEATCIKFKKDIKTIFNFDNGFFKSLKTFIISKNQLFS